MLALRNDELTLQGWLGYSLGQALSIIQGKERLLGRIPIMLVYTRQVHLFLGWCFSQTLTLFLTLQSLCPKQTLVSNCPTKVNKSELHV